MKRILSIITLCCFLKTTIAQNHYEPKYKTLAHELVEWEQQAEDSGISSITKIKNYHKLLDSIIDACKMILPKYDHQFNQDDALQTFSGIDSILYSFGFFVCIYVNDLSDALAPINTLQTNRKKQGCHIYTDKNPYREQFMKTSLIAHKMDCDISSIIYFSIGQAMNYPIFMVEVPEHNFVRWRNNDSSFFNWDTNAATSISNDCYKYECAKGIETGFNDSDEKTMNFLTDMDSNKIKAYYLPFIGMRYRQRKKISEAENIYNLAMSLQENNVYAMYFMAYMYLYDPACNNITYESKTYELANKAFALLPHLHARKELVNEISETCACAEALVEDFPGAIKMVKNSSRNKKLIRGFKDGKKCYEIYPNRP